MTNGSGGHASFLPTSYDGGVYLVEGVFVRRPREARGENLTAAQAARLKRQVRVWYYDCVFFWGGRGCV